MRKFCACLKLGEKVSSTTLPLYRSIHKGLSRWSDLRGSLKKLCFGLKRRLAASPSPSTCLVVAYVAGWYFLTTSSYLCFSYFRFGPDAGVPSRPLDSSASLALRYSSSLPDTGVLMPDATRLEARPLLAGAFLLGAILESVFWLLMSSGR